MSNPYSGADGLVRVYPASRALASAGVGLLWLHGGGFYAGDLDMPEAHWVSASLADRGITVISVDYRLAPKWTYPVPSDDVVAAWSWTVDRAPELGIRHERLAIGGASAGGNLAAGAVLRMLSGEVRATRLPSHVVLVYPTLLATQPPPDRKLRSALDQSPRADRFGPQDLRDLYEQYLGTDPAGGPIGAVPGLATAANLVGFPPTLIICGEVDELRVSADVFARNLDAAGIGVACIVEPNTEHGYLNDVVEPAATHSIGLIASHLTAPLDPPLR